MHPNPCPSGRRKGQQVSPTPRATREPPAQGWYMAVPNLVEKGFQSTTLMQRSLLHECFRVASE